MSDIREQSDTQIMDQADECDICGGADRIILDKIHKLAVAQWSKGTSDGWLKVMQLADPGKRSE